MNLLSVQGDGQNYRISLKTQHLHYEVLPVISGLQKGFAVFLSCYSRGRWWGFFPLRFSFTKGAINWYFAMLTFFPSEILVT